MARYTTSNHNSRNLSCHRSLPNTLPLQMVTSRESTVGFDFQSQSSYRWQAQLMKQRRYSIHLFVPSIVPINYWRSCLLAIVQWLAVSWQVCTEEWDSCWRISHDSAPVGNKPRQYKPKSDILTLCHHATNWTQLWKCYGCCHLPLAWRRTRTLAGQ